MTVFLSGDLPAGTPLDPLRHLDGLEAREMDVVRVPGVTDTMMQEPHARVLAARVQDRLEAADPEAGDHRGAIAGFP